MKRAQAVKGMQDLYGRDLAMQERLISILKKLFVLHNFEPLETPAMEYSEVLDANYGDEGSKLIYRVLNSGEILEKIEPSKIHRKDLSEKGLRYDLTVPMMRFLSKNLQEIKMPFKRYQIQKVWRADRPQKGRFREFLQCDIDIVGSNSYLCEIELISLTYTFFEEIGKGEFVMYINSIEIFKELLKTIGYQDNFIEIFTILDKIDKISLQEVKRELLEKNYSQNLIDLTEKLVEFKEIPIRSAIAAVKKMLQAAAPGAVPAIEKLEKIINYTKKIINSDFMRIDLLLARGLAYYTSTIFEVKPKNNDIGSVCGGGRYEGMLGKFIKKTPNTRDTAIGISFGISRLVMYLRSKKDSSKFISQDCKTLIAPLEEEAIEIALKIQSVLHKKKIVTEINGDLKRLKKALEVASKQHFCKIIVIGAAEIAKKEIFVKDLITRKQEAISLESFFSANTFECC